jgi:ketosteroid isomerase-like protein
MFQSYAIFRKFWLRKYDGGDVSSMEQSGRYSFWPIPEIAAAARAETAQTDLPDDLRKTMEEYHRAEVAFQKGDPQPFKDICSHADYVTIVGGMGGVEKGWANVEKRYEWAASRFSTDNSEPQSEIVSLVATPDMAYAVEIERSAARMAGSSELQQLALRVTTVFRREGGQWKVVHRHADPLMSVKQYGK